MLLVIAIIVIAIVIFYFTNTIITKNKSIQTSNYTLTDMSIQQTIVSDSTLRQWVVSGESMARNDIDIPVFYKDQTFAYDVDGYMYQSASTRSSAHAYSDTQEENLIYRDLVDKCGYIFTNNYFFNGQESSPRWGTIDYDNDFTLSLLVDTNGNYGSIFDITRIYVSPTYIDTTVLDITLTNENKLNISFPEVNISLTTTTGDYSGKSIITIVYLSATNELRIYKNDEYLDIITGANLTMGGSHDIFGFRFGQSDIRFYGYALWASSLVDVSTEDISNITNLSFDMLLSKRHINYIPFANPPKAWIVPGEQTRVLTQDVGYMDVFQNFYQAFTNRKLLVENDIIYTNTNNESGADPFLGYPDLGYGKTERLDYQLEQDNNDCTLHTVFYYAGQDSQIANKNDFTILKNVLNEGGISLYIENGKLVFATNADNCQNCKAYYYNNEYILPPDLYTVTITYNSYGDLLWNVNGLIEINNVDYFKESLDYQTVGEIFAHNSANRPMENYNNKIYCLLIWDSILTQEEIDDLSLDRVCAKSLTSDPLLINNIADGNSSTKWHSLNVPTQIHPVELKLQLTNSYNFLQTIQLWSMENRGEHCPGEIEVLYSDDDSTYTSLLSLTKTAEDYSHTTSTDITLSDTTPHTYYKIVITSNALASGSTYQKYTPTELQKIEFVLGGTEPIITTEPTTTTESTTTTDTTSNISNEVIIAGSTTVVLSGIMFAKFGAKGAILTAAVGGGATAYLHTQKEN